MDFDAVVLAGGSGRRLGGVAKPQLLVGEVSLLDHVVSAVAAAHTVVVVGPSQPVSRPVRWARESPVGSGPVAALAAALPVLTSEVVLTLAADLPWIAPAVPRLLTATPPDGVALLVDADGRRNHLAAAWRTAVLRSALAGLDDTADASVRSLLRDVPVVEVPDPDGAGRDCDTPADLAAARALIARPGGTFPSVSNH